jgi:HEPN domain-containing protein
MKKLTQAWVRKAEDDYQAAVRLGSGKRLLPDQTCFHCQQAVEKYLKALLQESGQAIPHIHDLEDLLDLLLPAHSTLRSVRRGMAFLTTFAVETRYPGENASKRQARSALRWLESVRDAVRPLFGIPPRPKKLP